MIYDKIENLGKYDAAFAFVSQHLVTPFVKGKFDIADPEYFGIGLEYTTQESEKGLWEAHRAYLDIHCIIVGEEIVEINDITDMIADNDYQHDYQLFKGSFVQKLVLRPGYFLVLFPNEVHKTGNMVTGAVGVKKKVFKLKINE